MSNLNVSCANDYRHLKQFDSCLFLHREPLQVMLLICTVSMFILLIFLFILLIIAKYLLPKLMTEKHVAIHSFISQSVSIVNHQLQKTTESYADINEKNEHERSSATIGNGVTFSFSSDG